MKYLYFIPIIFILLSIININFALLGIICMSIPFFVLFKTKKRVYCQSYCPRSSMMSNVIKKSLKLRLSTFISAKLRIIMFIYFIINMILLIFSTIQVSNESMLASSQPSILYFIKLPFFFQALPFEIHPIFTHISYGMFSMLLTTIVIGASMAIIFNPRSWCTICPITSVSNIYLNKQNQN